MKLTTITLLLPTPWASYLINGDASGLREGEIESIERALVEHGVTSGECYSVSEESEFRYVAPWDCANELGGDFSTYTFLKRE